MEFGVAVEIPCCAFSSLARFDALLLKQNGMPNKGKIKEISVRVKC
jgi:hypothetical protein